jgi:hypothetical protein
MKRVAIIVVALSVAIHGAVIGEFYEMNFRLREQFPSFLEAVSIAATGNSYFVADRELKRIVSYSS